MSADMAMWPCRSMAVQLRGYMSCGSMDVQLCGYMAMWYSSHVICLKCVVQKPDGKDWGLWSGPAGQMGS